MSYFRSWIIPAGAALALAGVAGCVHAPPDIDGAPSVPQSPATFWTPPPQVVRRQAAAAERAAQQVPPDLQQRISRLTLTDLVDLALRNNPATQASWAQARATADVYGATRGQYFPTIDASASGSRSKTVAAAGRLTGERTQYGPTLSLTYLLLDFGGRSGTVEEARQNLIAADFTHNATIQTVVLNAAVAYFTYRATEGLLAAEQSAIAEARANLAAAEGRHNVGLATIADVLQARTALSQQQLDLETTQGQLQTARGSLAAAIGIPANLPYDVDTAATTPPIRMVAADVDRIIDEAVRNRPDLAAARATAQSAAAAVRVARSAELPALSLSSNAGRTYTTPSVYGGTSYGITLGLSIPLFNGFARQYNVRAAEAQADVAVARAAQTRDQVITQVFTSYYALQTAVQRVTTADDLLASALQSEQVAAGRYRAGVGSILDLLTAETALANARAQQVQARWQWYTALVQLAHDAGAIGPGGEIPFSFAPDSAHPAPPLPPATHP